MYNEQQIYILCQAAASIIKVFSLPNMCAGKIFNVLPITLLIEYIARESCNLNFHFQPCLDSHRSWNSGNISKCISTCIAVRKKFVPWTWAGYFCCTSQSSYCMLCEPFHPCEKLSSHLESKRKAPFSISCFWQQFCHSNEKSKQYRRDCIILCLHIYFKKFVFLMGLS